MSKFDGVGLASQKAMMADEEKVFAVIEENNGLLTLDDVERLSGVPWRGGRLSDALYGLDQDEGRISQSTRDLFTCTFSVVIDDEGSGS